MRSPSSFTHRAQHSMRRLSFANTYCTSGHRAATFPFTLRTFPSPHGFRSCSVCVCATSEKKSNACKPDGAFNVRKWYIGIRHTLVKGCGSGSPWRSKERERAGYCCAVSWLIWGDPNETRHFCNTVSRVQSVARRTARWSGSAWLRHRCNETVLEKAGGAMDSKHLTRAAGS